MIPLCLILAACQSEPVLNKRVTATQGVLDPLTKTTSPVETDIVVTVTNIHTPNTINTLLTATPIPSPIPTLSLAEKEAIASELYSTNANCALPCWWGIVPGETDWQTAKHFFTTIATEISTSAESETDPQYSASVDIPVPEDLSEIGFLRHTFIIKDGIIVEIKLESPWGDRKINTISEILTAHGRPTEIWVDTWGYTFGNDYYPFRVVLFYSHQGILVKFFDEAELTNDYLIGCPQNHSGKLILWSLELGLTFSEALGRQQGPQYYKPLEEVTEMDVETFYQTYLDPNTETCITTPAELWLDR